LAVGEALGGVEQQSRFLRDQVREACDTTALRIEL
jgi:hypothetical protein